MSKKDLDSLFIEFGKTEDNGITVSKEVYVAQLPKGVSEEVAHKVLKNVQDFTATSFGLAKDSLVSLLDNNKEYDGVTAVFETGVEGMGFTHTINRDETSNSGVDLYSSLDVTLPSDELKTMYSDVHAHFASSEEEAEEELEEEGEE